MSFFAKPLLPTLAKATGWLTAATLVIVISVATVEFLSSDLIATEPQLHPAVAGAETQTGLSATGEASDGRAEIVAKFLERYNSPLKPYDHFGQVFVDVADRYNFDFRLLPAIAMQESNLCKASDPAIFNCLGFGIHKRGTLAFESYEANFERAGKELKANYIDKGLTTPELIMKKYTPSSTGSWANSVNQWMAEMRYDDRQSGRTKKIDANVMEFAQ